MKWVCNCKDRNGRGCGMLGESWALAKVKFCVSEILKWFYFFCVFLFLLFCIRKILLFIEFENVLNLVLIILNRSIDWIFMKHIQNENGSGFGACLQRYVFMCVRVCVFLCVCVRGGALGGWESGLGSSWAGPEEKSCTHFILYRRKSKSFSDQQNNRRHGRGVLYIKMCCTYILYMYI